MTQPSPKQGLGEPLDPASEMAHEAPGGDLSENPSLDQVHEKVRLLLEGFDSVRVRKDRNKSSYL